MDHAVGTHTDDRIGGRLYDRRKIRVLDSGGLLRGGIGDHRQRAGMFALPVTQRTSRHQRRDLVTVLGAKRKLKLLTDALSAKSEAALRLLDVCRIHELEHRPDKHLLRLVAE